MRAFLQLVTLLCLVAATATATGLTRDACTAAEGLVEPSSRGPDWWRCCLRLPPGILHGDKTKICYVCKGDSDKVNCDQTPNAIAEQRKDKAKAADPTGTTNK